MKFVDRSSSSSRSRRLGPYFFIRSRPFRETRIRAYVIRQHRLGRSVGEIIGDPYLARFGSQTLVWKVVCEPETIAALEADLRADIEGHRETLH
jgi:hypothetical protein